ncbi:MAG TPA: helix-turn-helix transcriptional regulator [Ktedonobacteraceae bacterium]|jgi:transcriptional regulator with XRE-family HTH domain|nr:helix-turn-helix transcriptional regulator [Ktedonobacteraceae bacterium]
MRHKDDSLTAKTTAEFIVQMLTDPEEGQEFFKAYVKAKFLEAAVDTLIKVRHQAGLTQAQVAERLNTKQTAIARLEADTEGTMSLSRYVDYALACGVKPHEISMVSLKEVYDYILENPQARETELDFYAWAVRQATTEPLKIQTIQTMSTPIQAGNTVKLVYQPTNPILNVEEYPQEKVAA